MSKKKVEKWEPCPRCGSNKTIKDSIGAFFVNFGAAILIGGIALIFIPFIGLPLLLLGIGFIFYGIAKKRTNKNLLRCKDCHNAWEYSTLKLG